MYSLRVVLDILKECFTIILNKIVTLFIKFQINFTFHNPVNGITSVNIY